MDELKNKIIEAVKFGKEKLGFTIVCQGWGDPRTNCACPLGCLLLKNKHGLFYDVHLNEVTAADLLEVSQSWVDNFIRGFDGEKPEAYYVEAWEFGKSLAEEIEPIEYSTFKNKLEDK